MLLCEANVDEFIFEKEFARDMWTKLSIK